jgi:hypothetical protein
MLTDLGEKECARLDGAIGEALDRIGGGKAEKLHFLSRLLRAEAKRSPLAASFMPGAWPFRAHRTLADLDREVTR